jgi:hypothetical protein
MQIVCRPHTSSIKFSSKDRSLSACWIVTLEKHQFKFAKLRHGSLTILGICISNGKMCSENKLCCHSLGVLVSGSGFWCQGTVAAACQWRSVAWLNVGSSRRWLRQVTKSDWPAAERQPGAHRAQRLMIRSGTTAANGGDHSDQMISLVFDPGVESA